MVAAKIGYAFRFIAGALAILKSGVKFSPFIQIWLKTAHKHAKFMQQSMKASQSWLQPSSGFNL
jgi:hypothetical protein